MMDMIGKHPEILIGIILLVIVVAIAGGSSGKTYTTSSGPSAADIQAKASAQAIANSSQADARRDIMATMLGYDAQRRNMRTSILQIRTASADSRYGIDSAERLGMATINSQDRAIQSAERIAFRSADSEDLRSQLQDKANQRQVKAESDKNALNFFGGIFNFFGKLITGGLF